MRGTYYQNVYAPVNGMPHYHYLGTMWGFSRGFAPKRLPQGSGFVQYTYTMQYGSIQQSVHAHETSAFDINVLLNMDEQDQTSSAFLWWHHILLKFNITDTPCFRNETPCDKQVSDD